MQPGPWAALGVVALALLALAGWLQVHHLPPGLPFVAVLAAPLVCVLPWWLTRRDSGWGLLLRRWLWRHEEGSHHSFGGTPLAIEDDGRELWIAAPGLQRASGRREPEDALAARHAGFWKRDTQGRLWVRLDAVVRELDAGRGRHDPRTLRLKHYLQRQVIFPAEQRRRRVPQRR